MHITSHAYILFISVMASVLNSSSSCTSISVLCSYVLNVCCAKQVDISKDGRALQKLRREAERAKRALSSQHQVRVEVESLAEGVDLSEPLTRARFEELNNDLFKKTLGPVKRVS